MKKLFFVLFSWLTVAAQAQMLPPHFPASSASFTQKYLMPKDLSSLFKSSLPNAMRTMQPNTTMIRVDSVVRMDSIYSDITHRYEMFEYNNEGRIVKDSMFYRFNANPRMLESKNEYEYDANGRLVKKRKYKNTPNYDVLSLNATTDYSYDANNLLLEENGVFVNGSMSKENYTYNANNQMIELISKYKNSDTSNWAINSKVVFNYDASGKPNYYGYYAPNASAQLYLAAKYSIYFNAGNKIDSMSSTVLYEDSSVAWASKETYSYDGNGNMSVRKMFDYDTISNTWTPTITQYYQLNPNYLMSNVLQESDPWPIGFAQFFTNAFVHLDVYRFVAASNTWKFNNLYDYYYSPIEITSTKTASTSQASLYPNPATNVLNVQLSGNATEGQISLYDAQGRRVLNQSVSAQQSTLDLQALPQGMYFYRLQTDGQKLQTGKVTKL
ncbi:Por secretion system C-terminal sorting domain-containing protein [Flexibacter flexilis DSM 6793]|uniref:Por secretion system C-terminal sorting domain-containing protein n=1 Tax=Flexibacter flexilis DSM 6793 TaxID=927664 RepID=A0A1I1EI89_9BACT|nr:T9SS type A sorting domain-containing protein [Flexibacter flexilis]SFB85128.1 Por secretion system C-terminal sorting domain-containing protein [Flexibacter flexilis DSM 6793]